MLERPEDRIGPLARREDVVVTELPGEVLVYDVRANRAHCLNRTAALVFARSDGMTPVVEIAAAAQRAIDPSIGEDAVWLALGQLGKAGLLEGPLFAQAKGGLTRQEMLKRGLIGSAVLLPVVGSVFAPTAAHAFSGAPGCAGIGQACVPNAGRAGNCCNPCITACTGGVCVYAPNQC